MSFHQLKLDPCLAPSWARGGHAQTLLGHLIPSPKLSAQGRKLRIPLPDGDELAAEFFEGHSDRIVFLFHGLGGSTAADYMDRTTELALKLGDSVYKVNHRGCGEGAGFARGNYHSGRAEDLAAVFGYAREKHPGKKQIAVGFSLSGNALLLLLSGARVEGPLPDAAISVNAPLNLEDCSRKLKDGFNRIYDLRFSLRCRADVSRRYKSGLLDRAYDFPLFCTLYDFDEIYTSKASGFRDRQDYYATCSTHARLSSIQVPTLMLTAEDDPFVLYENYRDARLSPKVRLHAEKSGGHMGYLSSRATKLGTKRWLDYALHEALVATRHFL